MTVKTLLNQWKSRAVSKYARLSYKRKTRLYCVGAAKTGTHSIAAMFADSVRAAHEPDSRKIIETIIELAEGQIPEAEVIDFIRRRDKWLCLDVDSSQLNFFLLDYLLKEFPQALFLLTVRDCYSWLDSFINDSLRRDGGDHWIKLREYRFQAHKFTHPPEEQALQDKGLYTLDGYLSYWANHNNKVLTAVPEERLLIVNTREITDKANQIADFAGLPREATRISGSHSFKNPTKFHMLREIDEAYLEAKVQEHCGSLMAKLYPNIRSLADAGV